MAKVIQYYCMLMYFLATSYMVNAQTFVFDTFETIPNCYENYKLNITMKIVGIKINYIYKDPPSNPDNDFAFDILLQYENKFSDGLPSHNSAINFWYYQFNIKSDNPAVIDNGGISNNISNIPITSDAQYVNYTSSNNITYKGSASELGFEAGKTYTSPSVLQLFNFTEIDISIGLPCMNVTDTAFASIDILPIALINWQATNQANAVLLHWEVAATDNTQDFIIQRSRDASNWQEIALIPKTNEIAYNYIDTTALEGDNYYRLSSISIDEEISFSNIIYTFFVPSNSDKLLVYPNPVKDYISIENLDNKNTIQLINLQGKIVLEYKNNYAGEAIIYLPYLPASVYLLRIIQENGEYITKKISIIE